jgi:hypothetical protein
VCSFDSRATPICGLIKDLKVSLATYLDISLLMDVVVIDVLDTWGMLLSKKRDATLRGSLQMDLSYATIPNLEGGFVTLYRGPVVRYQVKDPQNTMNEIMYLDDMMGNFCGLTNPIAQEEECQSTSDVWTLEFDGSHCSLRFGASIILIAHSHESTFFSYRLEFD